MPSEPAAVISVGAGIHQIPFIRRLARLGIPVAGFDLNPAAPGREICTHFQAISTWDADQAIEWLSSLGIPFQGVGSFSYGKALVTQQRIAGFFNLHGSLPERTFRMNEGKAVLRQSLREAGMSRLEEWTAAELAASVQGKLPGGEYIVKPSVGGSSRDVRRMDAGSVIRTLQAGEMDPETVIQAFVPGPEYRVAALVGEGTIPFVSLMRKENHPGTFFTGRLIPDMGQEDWARSIIQSLVDRFDIRRTALKLEVIGTPERYEIIELDYGIPGDYFESHFAEFAYGFDYTERYIDLITGKNVDAFRPPERPEPACFDYLYGSGDESLPVRNVLIQEVLSAMLGQVVAVTTQPDGTLARKPASNLDNVTAVLHRRPDIAHSELCSCLVSALRK